MRLIDANVLKSKAVPLLFPTKMEPCGHIPVPVYAVVVAEIEQAQTIDAVPVVRCRDCNQGELYDTYFKDQYYCHAGCGWNNGDFYCSYGERRANIREAEE